MPTNLTTKMRRLVTVLAMLLAPAHASATSLADPSDPKSEVAEASYQSSLDGFVPDSEFEVGGWKKANDRVGEIGGWRTYLEQARPPRPSNKAAQ